jgi:hypothetical protein
MAGVEEHKYQNQWQAYRKRRLLLGALLIAEFIAFLPFVALVKSLGKSLFHTDKMFVPAAIFWGAIYIFTAAQLRRFRCPRCNENFLGGNHRYDTGNGYGAKLRELRTTQIRRGIGRFKT